MWPLCWRAALVIGLFSIVVLIVGLLAAPYIPQSSAIIAFSSDNGRQRDIYLLDTQHQRTINLTNNRASDTDPAWSPDGGRLAFVSDRGGRTGVYTVHISGRRTQRLTPEALSVGLPSWSPDGEQIAFSVSQPERKSDIFVMQLSTGEMRRLTPGDGSYIAPTWSADGRQVAYMSMNNTWQIYKIDTAEPEPTPTLITRRDGNHYLSPAWSPVGIVYVALSNGGLQIYDLETGNITPLSTTQGLILSEPEWSPDGQHIVFTSRAGRGRISTNNALFMVETNNGTITQITDGRLNASQPAWRPD